MKRLLFFGVLIACAIQPIEASAQEAPMTRRDAFLYMWETIHRPAFPEWTKFNDLPETEYGSLEIDYAADRGIIDDDDEYFYPNETVLLRDALIWLFRTRNVTDDPKDVNAETLADMLVRYPIAAAPGQVGNKELTVQDVEQMVRLLDNALKEEDHEVSLYAEKFHGKGTAFGEAFDMHALTAAHRSFPPNTLVKVTNIANGKHVTVRINDRGPYVDGRDMDLSLAAFTSIADRSAGHFRATFERLGDSTLVGYCVGNETMQQRLFHGVALSDGVPTELSLGRTLVLRSAKAFVIRGVAYPDGNSAKWQDFVLPGEEYAFTPSVEGTYTFTIGTAKSDRTKEWSMEVVSCE